MVTEVWAIIYATDTKTYCEGICISKEVASKKAAEIIQEMYGDELSVTNEKLADDIFKHSIFLADYVPENGFRSFSSDTKYYLQETYYFS